MCSYNFNNYKEFLKIELFFFPKLCLVPGKARKMKKKYYEESFLEF